MPSNADITRRTYERAAAALLNQFDPRPAAGLAHQARLLYQYVGRPSIRCLVMGGTAAALLHELGEQGAYAAGMDYSRSALAHFRREAPLAPLVCADMRQLPFARSAFDAIFVDALLGHVERREFDDTVRGLRDALRPGGVLGVRLKIGSGEGLETHKSGAGKVWRGYWQPSEFIERLYALDFDLRHEQDVLPGRQTFLILRREY
ncbi:MAG: hypothetical protein BroJett014_28460 [Planctomycetota bacterium]|nr:hypothetical protein [Planctomycetota bacterium]GIK53873.1 MAG: hypothetical protein BroJett014_28460 [Planctomycetota bacterium]